VKCVGCDADCVVCSVYFLMHRMLCVLCRVKFVVCSVYSLGVDIECQL
jgi:hypothetical protein